MRLGRACVLIALAATGCLRDNLVSCGDLVCSSNQVCSASAGCVDPDRVEACNGLADGTPCTPTNSAPGTCQGGVCVQFCGDGVIEAGEECDDGNMNPSDGCEACRVTAWQSAVTIGGTANATTIPLGNPEAVTYDRLGNLYIADTYLWRVRRVDARGGVATIAGDGTRGFTGDGGPAIAAKIGDISDIAVDGLGNVFIADRTNARIRMINRSGIITTIAGNGTVGFSGDNGPASGASLGSVYGVALDGLGDVYIADTSSYRIRRVDTTGTITTIAGTGVSGDSGDGGPATAAQLKFPTRVTTDSAGNVYIADRDAARIRKVSPNGIITTVAGTGSLGSGGDGGPATAAGLSYPMGISIDTAGNLLIADENNKQIRRVDTAGIITTVAGGGNYLDGPGDGRPATSVYLALPQGVAAAPDGTFAIAETSALRIRHVDAAGTISTIAGNGTGFYIGEGGAATSAQLALPNGVAVDAAGNVYVADGNGEAIRKISVDGVVTTVAGNGTMGMSGDGGPAVDAELSYPVGVTFDAAGNMYISDSSNCRIRKVDTGGTITTFAGSVCGFSGDGGPATSAKLMFPYGPRFDMAGNLYFADHGNQRIRKIALDGTITTIAGNGTRGFSGDGGAATSAQLYFPADVAVDAQGQVFIADTTNNRVRMVDTSGKITTIAGTGSTTYSGDGGPATSAGLSGPSGLAFDGQGRLLIADSGNHRLRRIDTTGTITRVAGGASGTSEGDGGPALAAMMSPLSVTVDASQRIVVLDASTSGLATLATVRRIDNSGIIKTLMGKVDPDGTGPAAQAHLADPRALVVTAPFTLIAGGDTGTVQALFAQPAWLSAAIGRYPQPTATGSLARFRDATFGTVGGVAYDPGASIIYLTESSANRIDAVTVVDPADPTTWTLAQLANVSGTAGFADGALTTATFRQPTGLLFAPPATLYVADTGNHVIRAIDLTAGTVRTVAGTPATLGYGGDGGPATSALLYKPQGVARCGADLFIADTANNRIRRIDTAGTITTVLGDGTAASSGEGAPAMTFPIDGPIGIGCDSLGNVYATSTTTVRQLAADDQGVVDGTGPASTIYGAAPRTQYPASATGCLTGLAVIDSRTVEVTDACANLLVTLSRQ